MKYILTNASIITGRLDENGNMIEIKNSAVCVRDSKIEDIIPNNRINSFHADEIIDLGGKYIMPGMINAHVHLVPNNKVGKGKKKLDYEMLGKLFDAFPFVLVPIQILLEKLAKEHMFSGCTTIRTVAGLRDIDAKVRDKINSGKIPGPRMIVCNTAISVPKGHMAGLLATSSGSVDEALADLDKIVATNPDWIKLMITGGVLDAKECSEPPLKMPAEIVNAVCKKAHELGYRVCAHVESTEGVRVALENGVDTIEHGGVPDEEIIRMFKENNAADICTISPVMPMLYSELYRASFTEGDHINQKIVINGIIKCAEKCLDEGIPVGLGTDCGCPCLTHYDMWREVVYFNRYCNVSTAKAISTATYENASILGIQDTTGSIEVGKDADIIVLNSNPLEDLTTLRSPEMVMARGKLYRDIRIKKDKEIERELDTVLEKYQTLDL